MNNLSMIANAAIGGNIVTIAIRQLIRIKGMQGVAAFRSKVSGLQRLSGEMEYNPASAWLVGIPISVKKQEAYAYRADITQHSVENGSNLTDHVILQPVRVDISFEITNWDLMKPMQAHDLLTKLFEERKLVDLATLHTIMKNMVMVSYQAENGVPNWGALECRATFQQINFITLEAVKFPESKVAPTENTGGPDASKSAESARDNGQQVPKAISGL